MNGYITSARALHSFTAACGHVVPDSCEYIVKRPGVFYCSPACAAEDTSVEIVVRLADEANLPRLLNGEWASLLWLRDHGDGTYGLHAAGVAGDGREVGEAFLRVGLEMSTSEPSPEWPPTAQNPPTPEVEGWMERIRKGLGWITCAR